MTAWAARTDESHAEIRTALRLAGFSVFDASRVKGFVDLVVHHPKVGTCLIECKSEGKPLTAAQSLLKAQGFEITVLHNEQEALCWAANRTR